MILHIVKKDARRLWPAIAGTIAILASLAWHDRWRSDRMVGEAEGYLNLLLPLAWACLLALAVAQEPIAGDRQFWITRPYRRRTLLAAKLLFAALFVHLPSLAADCYVLGARGFSPMKYAPEVLWKQLVLACALTLPAMALASLVRSFSHFVFELVAVAAGLLIVASAYWAPIYGPLYTWEVFATVRWQVIAAVAAAAGAVVLALQYLRRQIAVSRGIAAAAAAGVALLYTLFLPQSAVAIRSAMEPGPRPLSIRLRPAPAGSPNGAGGMYVISIPIEMDGVPAGAQIRIVGLRARLSRDGKSYRAQMRTAYRPFERPPFTWGFHSALWGAEAAPTWMSFYLEPGVFKDLAAGPVTLEGEAGVTAFHERQPVWMGTSETRDFGDLGRCRSQIVPRRFSDETIKVECESPRFARAATRVRLWSPETGRDWKHYINEASTFAPGPRVSWLSPIERGVTYIDIAGDTNTYEAMLQVPRGVVDKARIEITRSEPVGYSRLKFEFRDIDLRRYLTREPATRLVAK